MVATCVSATCASKRRSSPVGGGATAGARGAGPKMCPNAVSNCARMTSGMAEARDPVTVVVLGTVRSGETSCAWCNRGCGVAGFEVGSGFSLGSCPPPCPGSEERDGIRRPAVVQFPPAGRQGAREAHEVLLLRGDRGV